MNAIEYHSDIAHAFDKLYCQSPDFQERYRVWTDLLTQRLQSGIRVLDAGCGSGVFSLFAAQHGAHVVAIDGSAAMIQLAKKAAAEKQLTLSFAVDLLPLNTVNYGLFDLVFSSSVLEYVPDLVATLVSLDRHLEHGGYLIVSMPNQQAVYRILERWFYRLVGRPRYLKHVLHQATPEQLHQKLGQSDYELINSQTYGGQNMYARLLRTCLPSQYANTLFVAVYRKK